MTRDSKVVVWLLAVLIVLGFAFIFQTSPLFEAIIRSKMAAQAAESQPVQ